MLVVRDEAIVLKTQEFGESDRMITLLSKNHGLNRALAKGVRKTSSKFGARLEPFMVVDLQLYRGKSIDIITQAVTLAPYGAKLVQDYSDFAAANVMAETAVKLANSDNAAVQYSLLVGAVRTLTLNRYDNRMVTDSYLLRSLALAGWAPSFEDCAVSGAPGPHKFFVPSLGGMVSDEIAPAGAVKLNPEAVQLLAALLEGNWSQITLSDRSTRLQASGAVAAYTQYYLESGLKSLPQLSKYEKIQKKD